MKKIKWILIISVVLTFSTFCQTPSTKTSFLHQKLKKLWVTEKGLATPESVLFDKNWEVIYVANINGKPTDKDGNGFIAKLSPDGKYINLHWIEGLNAPKGMGVFDGKLYVTDIDALVEIDIEKSIIINRYVEKSAKFFNDISIDAMGNVYVSDMQTNKIHRLNNGELSIWLEIPQLDHPNGLWVEGDNLLIGINGSVLKTGLKDKKTSVYIKDTGSIDGLVANGKGSYLISDWQGHVNLISPEKQKLLLLDTTPEEINAADIEYIVEKKILLIPTFFNNHVTAYRVDL